MARRAATATNMQSKLYTVIKVTNCAFTFRTKSLKGGYCEWTGTEPW